MATTPPSPELMVEVATAVVALGAVQARTTQILVERLAVGGVPAEQLVGLRAALDQLMAAVRHGEAAVRSNCRGCAEK